MNQDTRPTSQALGRSIGINLLWLQPGSVGGSEQYVTRLLRAAAGKWPSDYAVHLYSTPEFASAYPEIADRYQITTSPIASKNKAARIAAENSWLARQTSHHDLVHHFGGVIPYVRSAVPTVTIHDLQPIDLPDNFNAVKRKWLRHALPHTAKAARLIMVPSEFTARRLESLYGVSRDQISIVPQGADPAIDPASYNYSPAEKFGTYLIYPAIAYNHKRHIDIIRALSLMGDSYSHVNLVLTGSPGPNDEKVDEVAEHLGLSKRVHRMGRVSSAFLQALYRDALALVFPSAYEGFGNPVLEAMKLKCPVITSNAEALTEVSGGCSLVFGVGDAAGLANCIETVHTDRPLVEDMIARAEMRANQFDWDASGTALVEGYTKALNLV